MNKPPAFQWYPKDCDTDENVRAMDDTEFGFYMRCLNHAWLNRGLPSDLDELGRILCRTKHHLARVWPRVSRCFELADGRLVNKTQEKQRAQRADFIETKRKAANARWKHEGSNSDTDVDAGALLVECSATATTTAYNNKHKGGVSLFESELELAAQRMHDLHPQHRRCSVAMIKTKLGQIAKKCKATERMARIAGIEERHTAWCAYWSTKDPEYVKSLENWLAPTMGRFDEEPPAGPKPALVPQRYML